MHLRIPNLSKPYSRRRKPRSADCIFATLCANGPPIQYKLARPPLPMFGLILSVEGEPIEVTDPLQETRCP